LRFVRLEPDTGYAVGVNVAIDMSVAPKCVLFDTSVQLTGDAVTPLLEALDDPSVVVAGPFGLRARAGMKEFEDSAGPTVDAVEGYCMAFRRDQAQDAGGMDPKFRFYRIGDIDFSFRLRAQGGKAVVISNLPLVRHEHRVWETTPPAERDRLSKRNFYRFLDRWRMRDDLLVRD
jgi:GT2 family glycosyltransferase